MASMIISAPFLPTDGANIMNNDTNNLITMIIINIIIIILIIIIIDIIIIIIINDNRPQHFWTVFRLQRLRWKR